jgi:SAM-dependent methyltransferase
VTSASARRLGDDKALLRVLVERAVATPGLREKFECHSLDDKIVIWDDPQKGLRIRLRLANTDQYERIHNHRYSFTAYILHGAYQHTLYSTDQTLDEKADVTRFWPTFVREEAVGRCITLDHEQLHTTITEPQTISLMIQSPARKRQAFMIRRSDGHVWWREGAADETPYAAMVAARHRFLGRGHYLPLAQALRSLATRYDTGEPGLVVDLAGGTGYYLAAVLDARPDRYGVCVDLSAPALRRAARAHPRAAALGADVWRPLPLAAGSASLVLNVFGPRNAEEISRILAPGGTLVMATPGPGHLRELQQSLGLIAVDRRKPERIATAYRDYAQADVASVNYQLSLDHADLAALVSMGPSARHISPLAVADRLGSWPAPATATVDLNITAFQLRKPRAT